MFSVRKNRFVQFGIAGLLVVTTLCAIWLGRQVRRATSERQGVAAALEAGAKIEYSHDLSKDDTLSGINLASGLNALRKAIGDEYFTNVIGITSNKTPLTDELLQSIGKLADLKSLTIYDNLNVSDDGLAVIRQLRNLESLNLSNVDVSDTTVDALGELPMLTKLRLDGTKISDTGLKSISRLTDLENLSVAFTSVTDEGLTSLHKMQRLRVLRIIGTQIGDLSLRQIAKLGALEELFLDHTNVSDQGLPSLYELHNLKFVSIALTEFNPYLKVKPITHLPIPAVTKAGIDELRLALPAATVVSNAP